MDKKNSQRREKQGKNGQLRMVLDEMMVPIIGVEPTTFALRIRSTTFNYLFSQALTAFTQPMLMAQTER
ncbi:hypothetical protein HV163_04625 [Enterobacter hormaechei]|uniref:hypothetical protein n=1 Tax=Enterobacter hormaechei TaxID=158836 RepID=UPI0015E9BDE2|nr:hypothetical protein [Enterobacter hormaechei]QLT98319.1 hypothetical protein HV163_04625 [Enterobacter hormaechei]